MNSPAVSDHVRPTDADCPGGTYRVVGVDEDGVTLLEVADADGRRTHTGRVITVPHEALGGFESAGHPGEYPSLGAAFVTELEMLFWSVRAFLRQLAAHPLPAAVAVAVLVAGVAGDRLLSGPDVVFGGLLLVGSLALAYIGGGRLSR